MKSVVFGLSVFLLYAVSGQAQVAVTGKGFLLDAQGSITSAPTEVIAGKNSIKGAYSGADAGIARSFLDTDPTFVRFKPGETYTIAFKYRIVTASAQPFQFGFFSSTSARMGRFLPTAVITGGTGASGTATLTSKIEDYPDVRAGFRLSASGAIVIDDIRITDGSGRLFLMEDAEGPAVVPGALDLKLTHAITWVTEANSTIRSAAIKDLNCDGYPESIFSLTAPPPSNIPLEPLILRADSGIQIANSEFFSSGIPKVKHSPLTFFPDINGDGLADILFAEAGYDGSGAFPAGSGIGVALNLGDGKYKDISSLVPADLQATRSYALAAGDIDGDGRLEILLPDEDDGANTALLRWNGTGFDVQRNWIASSLWKSPTNLVHQNSMVIHDFDADGRQDLLLGAAPIPGIPNLRLLFGAPGGFTAADLAVLPDGLFGHAITSSAPVVKTADVGQIVVADFDNDGLPDIFSGHEETIIYQPGTITDRNDPDYNLIFANGGIVFADFGFQILMNRGSRIFADVTQDSSSQNLGRRHYNAFIPFDMNNDGYTDVVGTYQTKGYAGVRAGQWGTTVFLNDGTGAFQVVDGKEFFAVTLTPSDGQQWNLGAFVPTLVNPQRTEGIIFESTGGCGLGFCSAAGLNLYKVVANRAIGTGPGFADPATLGVPGFNEFYYLRHHPDAANAVRSGQYASGLAHYLALGKTAGYAISAANAKIPGFPYSLLNHGSISKIGTDEARIITTGYARLQPDPGSTTPSGVVIYGLRPSSYLVSETAVPATRPAVSGRIYAEVSSSVTTGVAIANPNDRAADIDLYYTDTNGTRIGSGRLVLPARTQIANFIDQTPLKQFTGSTFQGTFSYDSNVAVAAMAIRGVGNERGDFLMSTLPVVDPTSLPQTGPVVVPHFVDGNGWKTEILLVNSSDAVEGGTLEFRNIDGKLIDVPLMNQPGAEYQIPARSSRKLNTMGASNTTGSVRLVPTGGSATPVPLVVFSYRPAGVLLSEAGVQSIRGTSLRMFAEAASTPYHRQTGFALANPGPSDITVTFELFNRDGSTAELPSPTTRTLPAFGQTALFLTDVFSQTLPDPFSGVLRVSTSSATGIAAVGLRSLYNERGDFLITTTPPTEETAPADASERIFPQLAVGGGYSTEFVLFSGKAGQTSSGTVWLWSYSGIPLYLPIH